MIDREERGRLTKVPGQVVVLRVTPPGSDGDRRAAVHRPQVYVGRPTAEQPAVPGAGGNRAAEARPLDEKDISTSLREGDHAMAGHRVLLRLAHEDQGFCHRCTEGSLHRAASVFWRSMCRNWYAAPACRHPRGSIAAASSYVSEYAVKRPGNPGEIKRAHEQARVLALPAGPGPHEPVELPLGALPLLGGLLLEDAE